MTVSHLLYRLKYHTMRTIVYGDSFSFPGTCNTSADDMWYTHVFAPTQEILNRAKPLNNTETMFLQATHDCVTHKEPAQLVIALGPLQRLPTYTDGWYDKETLKPVDEEGHNTDLSHCQQHFNSFVWRDAEEGKNLDLFHPTYLWARLYSNIITLDALCRQLGHRLLVLHMSVHDRDFNTDHPLIRPLGERVSDLDYIGETHSCTSVCRQANIKPWDYDKYGWIGHHSADGQRHFGLHIKNILNPGH